MTVAFRTGSGAANGAAASPASLTVPATVQTGDQLLIFTYSFATVSLASTGTTPVQVGTVTGSFGSVCQVWQVTAGASDPSATLTATSSSGAVSIACAAWSGASSILDVLASGHSTSSATTWVTTTASTVTANDWSIEAVIAGNSFVTLTPPGTLTSRASSTGQNWPAIGIADSNASVGPGGTTIGGETWSSNGSVIWASWTIGIAPASSGTTVNLGTPGITFAPNALGIEVDATVALGTPNLSLGSAPLAVTSTAVNIGLGTPNLLLGADPLGLPGSGTWSLPLFTGKT